MDRLRIRSDWQKTSSNVFWAEIAPTEHVVQIYESDESFLELLSGFVAGGIMADECTIVLATRVHLTLLKEKLTLAGFDLPKLSDNGIFIGIDAEEALSRFMVNDWPDENLFTHMVTELIARARSEGRVVRAFGEMVAILWANGQIGATIRLEQLWNKFCQTQAFCLFCAYPQSGFAQDATDSIGHICNAHTKMITSGAVGMNDIYFKQVDAKLHGNG
jgi:hypothetical protein